MKSEENPQLAWLCIVAFCNGGTLAGALAGANISYWNFTGNFTGANLSGANLSGANLSGTNLSDANLCDAKLIDTKLNGVNLSDANLTGADLTGAKLVRASLIRADLTKANLSCADFTSADLRGVGLTGANFSGANFSYTITHHRYLTDNMLKFKLKFNSSMLETAFLSEIKRDQLMNNEIHQFKNWYMTRSYMENYTFHFEDEVDAMMAKLILK